MVSLFFSSILACLIFYTARLQALEGRIPRRYWISLGGGISLAYVFTTFLAELSEIQQALMPLEVPLVGYLLEHIHLLMLVGIVMVYSLEWLARTDHPHLPMHPSILGVHLGFFTLHSGLVGYLLQHNAAAWFSCLLLTVALGIHLSITTHELFEHHPDVFQRRGRWLLSGSLMLGWGLGQWSVLPPEMLAATIAFVAGVLIFQVLKHELPEKGGHFGAFLVGVSVNSCFLVMVSLLHTLETSY
ncbi:MAG: hypothetical protein HC924_04425 [Synechococcaceae cyanobacterium SM2_3_2]|nr:hypothetical protein [Synechococcaceae cyanobacterium SM2_3_2]